MLSSLGLNDPALGWDALHMIAVGGFVLVALATVVKTFSQYTRPHLKLDSRQAKVAYAISACVGMGLGSFTLVILLAITWALLSVMAQRYGIPLGFAVGLGVGSVFTAVQSAAMALDSVSYAVERAVLQEQVTVSGVTYALWAEVSRGVFAWAKAHAESGNSRSVRANMAAAAVFLAASVLHQRGTFLDGFVLSMVMAAGVLAITYSLPSILAMAVNYMHTNSWCDGSVSLWGSFLLAVTLATNAFVGGVFNQAAVPPNVFLLLCGFNFISSTISGVAGAAKRQREAENQEIVLADPYGGAHVSNQLTGDVQHLERSLRKATRVGRDDW